MRNLRLVAISLLFSTALLVFACQKEDAGVTVPSEQEQESSTDDSQLVSYELIDSVPAKDAAESALSHFEEIDAPVVGDIDIEQYGLQLKAYRIVYKTVDIKGDSISLSGDICYIDAGQGNKRVLESVSLFHPAFATSEEHCCEYEQYAFIGRSIHNALVVYPHYQGFFAGREYRITVSESLLKARQAIDCELAALALVEKLDDVEMKSGYYTDNMGISCGTGAALATQYLLEQDEQLKKINKSHIFLNSTYCCEGPVYYSKLITHIVNEFPYEDLQDAEDFSQIGLVSIVVGTYDTYKGLRDSEGNEYFQGIENVEEYFNPEAISKAGLDLTEIIRSFREGKLDHHSRIFKEAGLSSRDMINPSFIVEDKLDENNRYIKALYGAMSRNEVIAQGWTPKTSLTISHSAADELCPLEHATEVYLALSKHGLNLKVRMNVIPGLAHTEANQFYAIRDLILKKNPCSIL